ncbi:MAG: heparinase II/III family protein [bacterium]
MSLLLDSAALAARKPIAAGALAPLANGLRAELAPVLDGRVEIPRDKALLSRTGGRCPHDGALLAFDPLDPRHRCPRCGREVTGELHDRFRTYSYQLWLAERVVHAAALGALLNDRSCTAQAESLLGDFAERYLDYPNRDNVLGPSRPFFSTYLESIWLLQLALALDLLETDTDIHELRALGNTVRARLIEPSAELIASYDEGMSNRQVWNNAALMAAGRLLGQPEVTERAIVGPSGLFAHLDQSLLDDGSWYEGENYHLFAHRGLWYGVMMAERLGYALPEPLRAKFDAGFASPFRTLLPDLTYPSRRDSQYAVSVRQPRFAESCELGLARREDQRLVGMLARLYDPLVPRGETGRAASTADVERNLPATGLTRADLSWRSLLFARAELPPLVPEPMRSDLLPGQGFGIIRREEGRVYVALDYGHSGGGHGHPDRLNLLLSDGDTRWFDDPGTGSYTDESLHWYRSTLAHTAPLIDGHSQPRVHGRLVAFEDSGPVGWMSAEAPLGRDLTLRRSVVVMGDYLVDTIEWNGSGPHEVALPVHGVRAYSMDGGEIEAAPASLEGGAAREDGFAFLRETTRLRIPSDGVLTLTGARSRDDNLDGWLFLPPGSSCWSAVAPGAPGNAREPMVLAKSSGRSGAIVAVWSWRGEVTSAIREPGSAGVLRVERSDGGTHLHGASPDGWRVTFDDASGKRIVELVRVPTLESGPSTAQSSAVTIETSAIALPSRTFLGEPHYRRSEEHWDAAGRPAAMVTVAVEPTQRVVVFTIEVPRSERRFVPIDAENLYDNEPAAINGDGVQLYVIAGEARGGWLMVPVTETKQVGIRPIDDWARGLEVTATWNPLPHGYRLVARVTLPSAISEIAADVIVNEAASGRDRRRGQLVLSGAAGEFVYLRGDRHEPERLLRFSLADD